jgi:ornithine cyclodeaminase/alanine dehydrogenase
MKDVIDAVEDGFRDYVAGKYTMPLRGGVPVKKGVAFNYMPVLHDEKEILAVKTLGIVGKGTWLMVALYMGAAPADTPRGTPLPVALMNGAWLTAMRTGAVSGVAAKYLARKDSDVVGMFGAGRQAQTQLEAVANVLKLKEARIYDPYLPAGSPVYANLSKKLGFSVHPVASAKEAVAGCDVVLTATTATEPVFKGEWLEPGTFVSGIGSHHGAGKKELDTATIRNKLVVDQREACLAEAGDIMDPIADGSITADHIYAELGELVTGKKKGRVNDKEITVYKSVGIAVQDIATAIRAYELAKKKGIGVDIPDF